MFKQVLNYSLYNGIWSVIIHSSKSINNKQKSENLYIGKLYSLQTIRTSKKNKTWRNCSTISSGLQISHFISEYFFGKCYPIIISTGVVCNNPFPILKTLLYTCNVAVVTEN